MPHLNGVRNGGLLRWLSSSAIALHTVCIMCSRRTLRIRRSHIMRMKNGMRLQPRLTGYRCIDGKAEHQREVYRGGCKYHFTQTNELSSEMENQDVFSEFEGKLTNLNNNLIGYSDMIDEFISANAVLEAEIKTADGELP